MDRLAWEQIDPWLRLRVSLRVGALTVSFAIVVGTFIGSVAGYFGGALDQWLMRIMDVILSVPSLLLALVVAITIGASFTIVMGLMVLLAWSQFVRNVRADVLVLKGTDYVVAARIAGASRTRILIKHILPGTIGTTISSPM